MNSGNPITAFQHAVLGFLLLAIVVLLTLCFSVAGTFACSVLAGIILGAGRYSKWRLLPVSLLFPAVTLGLLQFSKGDIPAEKRILVSLLCWAAFVATYLVAYLLVCMERRAGSDSPAIAAASAGPAFNTGAQALPADAPATLTLQSLQGRWSFEAGPLNAPAQKKTIEVAGDELTLCLTDARGAIACQAKAHLKLH